MLGRLTEIMFVEIVREYEYMPRIQESDRPLANRMAPDRRAAFRPTVTCSEPQATWWRRAPPTNAPPEFRWRNVAS